MALRGASGATGPLRGFLPRPPRQRGPGDVWGPAQMGMALVNRRQRTLGPNPRLWRIPDRRGLASRNRSTDVYPRRAGSDGVVGTVRLVEGASHGRSYPFATPHGGLLRSHEASANGPRPRRSVGRHYRSDVGSTHRLKEMRSLRCRGLYPPDCLEEASLLKNPFALSSAPGSGAEYAVFVAFWPCFRALLDRRPGRHLLFQQAEAFSEGWHTEENVQGLSIEPARAAARMYKRRVGSAEVVGR